MIGLIDDLEFGAIESGAKRVALGRSLIALVRALGSCAQHDCGCERRTSQDVAAQEQALTREMLLLRSWMHL